MNKPLLRKTLAFITKYPEKHNQRAWCGTKQCFAGWACHLDGWRRDHVATSIARCDNEWLPGSDMGDLVRNGDTVASVLEVAKNILGLTWEQAYRLFNSTNTRRDLRAIVQDLCSSR